MPCANADGSHKLELQAIGRAKKPRSFKKFGADGPPVYYTNSENAWQTQKLFEEWFYSNFVPAVRRFSEKKNIDPKAILLLDNCSAHSSKNRELISDDGKICVVFLPPRTTSLIQPMDQRVIYSLKTKYRKRLILELLQMEGEDFDEKLNRLVFHIFPKIFLSDVFLYLFSELISLMQSGL